MLRASPAPEIHEPDGSNSLPGGLVSEVELNADTQTIDFSITVFIVTHVLEVAGQVRRKFHIHTDAIRDIRFILGDRAKERRGLEFNPGEAEYGVGRDRRFVGQIERGVAAEEIVQ